MLKLNIFSFASVLMRLPYVSTTGVTGYPFFGQLILDCLNRTENAMTQARAFKAAELCLQAEEQAVKVAGQGYSIDSGKRTVYSVG